MRVIQRIGTCFSGVTPSGVMKYTEAATTFLGEGVQIGSLSKGIWNLLTDHPKQELVKPQGPQMGGMEQMGM